MPRAGIARWYGNRMLNFIRLQTLSVHSNILRSHQQGIRVPVDFYLQHCLLVTIFFSLILTVLIGGQWYFCEVLVFTRMTNDVEHSFLCLFAISVFFGKMSFSNLCLFF